MRLPPFYSVRPAGNSIPLSFILRSIEQRRRNGHGNKSSYTGSFLDGTHSFFLSSGRAAFWLILRALSALRSNRRKIVIPAYTCPALVSAILKADLQPVLCDVNRDDFDYSLANLAHVMDDAILAVIGVHLFGFPTNTDAISQLCKEYNTFFVEDSAQAFGNQVPSSQKRLGLIGDIGFYSFGRGKPLSALHGGLAVTASQEIYEQCLRIYEGLDAPTVGAGFVYGALLFAYCLFANPHLYGIVESIQFLHLGETIYEPDFPIAKGTHIASGIIETLLEDLNGNKQGRIEKTQWYRNNLPDTTAFIEMPSVGYPLLRYPLLMEDRTRRDTLLKELSSIGISGALFYPCPLNELPGLRDILQDNRIFPNAKNLSERLVTLPVHENVTERDMINIQSAVHRIHGSP